MPEPKRATVLELTPSKWATPEEVLEKIEELKAKCLEHRIVSLVYVAELSDGNLLNGSTKLDDRYKVAAALIQKSIELLGFKPRE